MDKITLTGARNDFPFFKRNILYLDSAATTQRPRQVLDAIRNFYEKSNSNVHRGVNSVAEEATVAYEQSREKVANFINANPKEVVFLSKVRLHR